MGKAEYFFRKIADAKQDNKGGAFIEHGTYENLLVHKVAMIESTNPATLGKMFFVVEFEVGSFTGGQYTDVTGKPVNTAGLYQKGSRVSDSLNLEDAYGNGITKAKALTAAILASKHSAPYADAFDSVDEDDIKSICGPEQPGAGALLRCSATHIITKQKKDYTVRNYLPQVEITKVA